MYLCKYLSTLRSLKNSFIPRCFSDKHTFLTEFFKYYIDLVLHKITFILKILFYATYNLSAENSIKRLDISICYSGKPTYFEELAGAIYLGKNFSTMRTPENHAISDMFYWQAYLSCKIVSRQLYIFLLYVKP